MDSIAVYGRSFGMVYACLPCESWVGVHKSNNIPLGRLANYELRDWKKRAHAAFDPLWKRKMEKGFKKGHVRAKAYIWLAKQMEINPALCHIGMFDVDQCRMVVNVCSPYNQVHS